MEFNFEVTELSQFLQDELTVSSSDISLVMQKKEQLNAPIPMLLWQYGLVSRSELDRIFDWLEHRLPLILVNIEEENYATDSD